jgi:hypothetical protein
VPSWKEELGRVWNGNIGKHRADDPHDFLLDPAIGESFYAHGVIALVVKKFIEFAIRRTRGHEWLELTVTVTNTIPDPGKKLG